MDGDAAIRSQPLATVQSLRVLLGCRVGAVRNQLRNLQRESLFKIVVVTALGCAFWIGLFCVFLHAFNFLNVNAAIFRPLLVRHILGLFFVALLFMLVFSNAVISYSNLFRARETAFLYALPVRRDTVFLYKLIESVAFSSWAVFALGLPLLLAFGIKSDAEWYYYPCMLVFMVPFVLLPAGAGALLSLLVCAVIPRHGGKALMGLALVIVSLGIHTGVSMLNARGMQHAYSGLEVQASVGTVLGHLSFTQHYLTPNYWMTEGLLGFCESNPQGLRHSALFLGALASSALFFLALGWFLAGALYERAYSAASAGDPVRRMAGRGIFEYLAGPWRNSHPQTAVLMIKDVKTFLRDPAQWSQVLVFFGILTLYIGNLRNFSYPVDEPFYNNLISFLNVSATCMTLATMTSRFIFPLISLEGRRFWVLGLAPLQRRDILLSKFYFALGGALCLTTFLILLSNSILNSSTFVTVVQLITGGLVSVGLSGLSTGMGALFPSFEERNPSRIVSGFGGTLTLILALGLVAFTILGEGLVCHRYLLPRYAQGIVAAPGASFNAFAVSVICLMALLNLLAAYIPMRMGLRALERVEF